MSLESIQAFRLPDEVEPVDLKESTAVVVDVLRATSTITTAIANGADVVIPCDSIESALATRENLDIGCELCGERRGAKIDGFDRGNSPLEYSKESASGKVLVFTTTNGTRALLHARFADAILLGAFINLSSVAKLAERTKRLAVICSGTDRKPTWEDEFFAGALIEMLVAKSPSAQLDSTSEKFLEHWRGIVDSNGQPINLIESLKTGQGGINLVKRGFERDIEYCAQIDFVDTVACFDANRNRIEAV